MTDIVKIRCNILANYIVDNKATVRQTAKIFNVSKSTVHIDVTKRLSLINPSLAKKVAVVLEENKAQRHIRGGEATRQKYIKLKQVNKRKDTICP